MDFDSMKYAELRRLAKEAGFKANMKADKLREALKQHYSERQQQNEPETCMTGGMAQQEITKDTQDDELAPTAKVFVTKRRGKGSKRKNSDDDDTERESRLPLEVDEKVSDSESGTELRVASAKKRRVSSAQDSVTCVSDEVTKAPDADTKPGDTETPAVAEDKGVQQRVVKAGKIPRHESLLKRTTPILKPTTPNFKKLHEAHFNKMESIDSYVQRKTKQMDLFKNSVKELKLLTDKTVSKPAERKTQARASRASLFSPGAEAQKPAPDRRRHTQLGQPSQGATVPFRPSVLSTRRINVRFSEATQNNEHKRSLIKTPARRSPCVELTTPGGETTVRGRSDIIKTSALSSTKTPRSTFVFSGNTSVSNTPGTNKRSGFDLKASLSRPLTYKPHKGKLKPFGPTQENAVGDQTESTTSHQKNYKQHQVQTREDRRTKRKEDRRQKKENILGARRGLAMS